MPVIDVMITKLEANKNKLNKAPDSPNVNISNNSKVVDIKKQKLPKLGEAVVVDFEYETKYEPEIGNVIVGGTLIFHDKKLKDYIKEEKGNIMLKGEGYAEVQNMILGVGTVQALLMAKELKLPPPIQLPSVSLNKKGEEDSSKKSYA